MTDLIQRLTTAIFRQEGRPADHTNPGNLRDCPWLIQHTKAGYRFYPYGKLVQYAEGFWVPRSRAEGVAGAAHVVALHIAKGDSLAQLISTWAPPTDHNNTALYIAHLKEWAAIPDENCPLWDYLL